MSLIAFKDNQHNRKVEISAQSRTFIEGGKGYFRDSWSALFFSPWNVRWLIFSSWIVISIVAVKRDFEKIIFCEKRNKCLIRREPWFSLCLCYFQQPLLRNKWYCVTVTGRLIPVATTWLVLVFGDHQPSFSSSVSSISTIMEEAHQRDVRDDQDHQQGQQVCMVLPNVTVSISFFFLKQNVLLFFREAWNAYFIFRELWKDRFIFREMWSRPPLYHPLHFAYFRLYSYKLFASYIINAWSCAEILPDSDS